MEFTKRQYTEIRKRLRIAGALLSEKYNIHHISIDYKTKVIMIDSDEMIVGYYVDYKTCKQLQLNLIDTLNNIDEATHPLNIIYRVKGVL